MARTRGRKHGDVAAWMLVAAVLAPPWARAEAAQVELLPNETLVTSQPDLIDAEYSQSRGMIAWADQAGGLWVAGIDPDTGMFIPEHGMGQLVDPDALRTADLLTIGNGPEWISTATGEHLVYTKFRAGLPHVRGNARLALAELSPDGTWSHHYLSSPRPRSTPHASHDALDPAPRISYVDLAGHHFWRDLYDPASETPVPQYPRASSASLHFVVGARAAVFAAAVQGVSQVFWYWLDTSQAEQITFDSGQKDLHTRPWIWQAPEYGGEFVLATVVDDTELRVYRLPLDGTPADWTMINSIRTPEGGWIDSPEPFIHDGRSYLTFAATMPPASYPSAIFLAGIDADQPVLVQLTPNWPQRVRSDPEVFVVNDGPYIYYNRAIILGTGTQYCLLCNEGVYRAYAGLAAVP